MWISGVSGRADAANNVSGVDHVTFHGGCIIYLNCN